MSTTPLTNVLLGLCNDLIGGSSLTWRYHHQVTMPEGSLGAPGALGTRRRACVMRLPLGCRRQTFFAAQARRRPLDPLSPGAGVAPHPHQ